MYQLRTMNDLIRPICEIFCARLQEWLAAGVEFSTLLASDVSGHDHTSLAVCDRDGVTVAAWALGTSGSFFVRPDSAATVALIDDSMRGADLRWYALEKGHAPRRVTAGEAAMHVANARRAGAPVVHGY